MSSETLQKCTIVNLDAPFTRIEACYNPNKIKIGRKVPWKKHRLADHDAQMVEFIGADNKSLSIELFLDGREKKIDVYKQYITHLMQLTESIPRTTQTKHGERQLKRAPFVMIVWGLFPPFKGVIDSVDVEYTMFLPNGTPVRATCSLTLTEVDVAQMTGAQSSESDRGAR